MFETDDVLARRSAGAAGDARMEDGEVGPESPGGDQPSCTRMRGRRGRIRGSNTGPAVALPPSCRVTGERQPGYLPAAVKSGDRPSPRR